MRLFDNAIYKSTFYFSLHAGIEKLLSTVEMIQAVSITVNYSINTGSQTWKSFIKNCKNYHNFSTVQSLAHGK